MRRKGMGIWRAEENRRRVSGLLTKLSRSFLVAVVVTDKQGLYELVLAVYALPT
jgi:hypothetical protein